MTQLLKIIKQATGIDAVPLHTDNVDKDCIVYKDYFLSDDGCIAQHRLELRIITKTYAQGDIIQHQLINALVNRGDDMKIDNIYQCETNGGGRLMEYETDTIHTLIYFNYITRSQVND